MMRQNHMEKILWIQRQKGLQMAAMKMNTRIVSLMMMKIQRSCHLPLFIAVKRYMIRRNVRMVTGSHKRLRKKFQFIESDDEDKMPISFIHEKESAVKSMGSEAAKKCEKEKGETSEKVKDNGNWVSVSKGNAGAVLGVFKRQRNDHHSFLPLCDMGSRNGAKPKKKRGKHYKEEVPLEDDFFFCRALGQQKSIQSEVEADKLDLDFVTTEDKKTTNDKNVEKLKRRRKKYAKEKESPDGDNQLTYEHKAQPDEAEAKNTLQDMLVTKEENQKERNGEVKNTLQDMLVTDEGNQKDTNDEEDKVQDEAKTGNTRQDMLLVKKENQKQTDDESVLLGLASYFMLSAQQYTHIPLLLLIQVHYNLIRKRDVYLVALLILPDVFL
ncbi:hypothetical protein OIU77_003684 [Salix suchowensis]|uniref:Uncharacterized protein n=1 Tax=Salix suchowensis TaxID=1278906 RepID=A0ABQ9B3K6_9ROSI|nr:hypothetical protein OIU77_003684 [Salix suchowensis]